MRLKGKKIAVTFLSLALIVASFTGCQKKEESYSHTDFAMGTVTNITLYGKSDSLEKTEQEIIFKVKKLEKEQISWRIKGSQLSKVNREVAKNQGKAKIKEPLKSWLLQALKLSKDSYEDGRGTVDPSIGQLTQLWNFESDHPSLPKASDIKRAVNSGLSDNSRHVMIDSKGNLKAKDEKTKFDLGAYGKGIGTDVAWEFLKKKKDITGAMVALGGSILVYGQKLDGSDWNVGIQDPYGKDGEVLGGVKVSGGTCISTSGDYEKYFIDKKTGKKYFHILDPKTGYSAETNITSCTIVCNSGINSDGLSTACFILGVKKSQKLLKKYHAKAIFVDKKKNVYVSDGLDFSLTDDDYKIVK